MEQVVPFVVLAGIVFAGWKWYHLANAGFDDHGPKIICPNANCGYTGEPRKESRGSVLAGLFLCCIFLLPGIIYFIVKGGYRYLCPKCGLQIRADN